MHPNLKTKSRYVLSSSDFPTGHLNSLPSIPAPQHRDARLRNQHSPDVHLQSRALLIKTICYSGIRRTNERGSNSRGRWWGHLLRFMRRGMLCGLLGMLYLLLLAELSEPGTA